MCFRGGFEAWTLCLLPSAEWSGFTYQSQDYIHQFFEEHQGKEFVGINHGEEFEWDCRRKMMRYWLFTSLTRSKYGALNAITRRLNKYLSMLLMPFLHRQKMDLPRVPTG